MVMSMVSPSAPRSDDDYRHCLWRSTALPDENRASLSDAVRCDVTVIGAGFTGLRSALELSMRGVNVVVLEAGDVGWGASGRNGGQVNPLLPVASPDLLFRLVGSDYFERLASISLGSSDELFDLVSRHRISCDARRCGWLRVDHCPSARDRSRLAADSWNRHGAGLEFLDGDDLTQLTGTDFYSSGTLSSRGGAVQPLSLARGLARVAESHGARIFVGSPAASLSRANSVWRISTPLGFVESDWVILATNGYTDDLFSGLSGSILPLVSVQIATDSSASSHTSMILPLGHTIADTRRVIMYARREPDGTMIFGSIGHLALGGGLGGYGWLYREASRVFPSLSGVTWRYRWGGRIALTPDRIPYFCEPSTGLVCGLGYNGRGVAMSLVMGRVLAERVLGASPDSLPFPVSPVRRFPFRWFQLHGSRLAISLMRLRDALELRFRA